MDRVQGALGILISSISEQNYDRTLACYRLWFEITRAYSQNHPDQVYDSFSHNRGAHSGSGKLIHSTAHLILRFACDAESDSTLSPHTIGLQNRFCARILQEFFEGNMGIIRDKSCGQDYVLSPFLADVNFIAHWANLGCLEESPIRHCIVTKQTRSSSCSNLRVQNLRSMLVLRWLTAASNFTKVTTFVAP